MAIKLISILSTLAIVQAGYIESPSTLYNGEYHGYQLAPATAKVAYSSAPAVSHVYSTLSSQNYGPVEKTLTYTTPIQKSIAYPIATTPVVQKSYDEIGHGLSTYYTSVPKTAATVLHKPVLADLSAHYSTENHYDNHLPTHTLAYAPVTKEVAYTPIVTKDASYAPVPKTLSYPTVTKSIAYAPAVYNDHNAPIYGHTHESVERSHDGTVSHYGKTLATPHSHVHKTDTRITNDHHYKVAAVVPSLQQIPYHSAPVINKIESSPVYQQYAQHTAPIIEKYAAPIVHQKYVAPIVQKYATPVVEKYVSSVQPVTVLAGAQYPVQESIKYTSIPATAPIHHQYGHSTIPIHQQYAHTAPIVAQKTISYSPAEAVAHATFESTNAHYSW